MSAKSGAVKVTTHHSNSPCRDFIHTGDEIIAVNNLRIRNVKELNAAIFDKIDNEIEITICRQAVLQRVVVKPISNPNYKVKLDGKGNKIWRSIADTKQ